MNTDPINPIFQRLSLLVGTDVIQAMNQIRVIVFGVGGVGSWAAESLVRSGVQHITLVDSDTICITNVNRQLQANSINVGCSKVDELKAHLLKINPDANVETRLEVYETDHRERFPLKEWDYVIDAIDSVTHKIDLIEYACSQQVPIFSSMGAANKLDPTQIQVSSIWKTQVDPLAKLVRKGLRKRRFKGDFKCVYSPELLPLAQKTSSQDGSYQELCSEMKVPSKDSKTIQGKGWTESKKVIPGSAVHITATFGNVLAGLVLNDQIRTNFYP